MTYLQTKSQKHFHKYFVDSETNDLVCLCGKVRGVKKNDVRFPKESKFHNQTSIYNGYSYDSIKEAQHAMLLDHRKKNKEIKDWERQYPIEIYINGIKIFRMKVDFLLYHNDGSKELQEVKGYATDIFNLKLKLIDAVWLKENPEYTYTLIR